MKISPLSEQFWNRVSRLKVAVVGDLMIDRHIVGRCERVSPEAPVVVVLSEEEFSSLGGAGNVVQNLCGLGAIPVVFGVVGDDRAGREIKGFLEELGANLEGLIVDESRLTVEKSRVLARNHHVVRVDRERAEPIDPDVVESLVSIFRESIGDIDVVLVSDYLKGVCVAPLVEKVIEIATADSIPVIIDPKGRGYERYRGATCITPNAAEAALELGVDIVDDQSAANAGRQLTEITDSRYVLITRGAQGMTLVSPDGVFHFSSRAQQVFDVSGAGDTVVATLAVGIGAGLDWRSASDIANRAAGKVVSKVAIAPIDRHELTEERAHDKTAESRLMRQGQLKAKLKNWRKAGKRIVFTNGCFDILHRGHVYLLEQSRCLGDVLVVGLNSDASVARIKGPQRPLQSQEDRAFVLAALSAVDAVVVFDEDDPYELVKLILPDVLTKGDDYSVETIVGADIVLARGGRVETIPRVEGHSTSRIASNLPSTESP